MAQQPRNWKLHFFTVWAGQACSLLGSQLVSFALIWWLTVRTGSATALATATLVSLLPGILLGPFAGALVDRWSRRRVMMAADSLIALVTLGLVVISALGRLQPWHIYAVMLLRSAGGAFHWPAMQASTSLMVPSGQLSRVAGMNQTLQGAMSIVAPPLGALLLSLLPLHGILLIDVGTALPAIVPLCFIAIPQPAHGAEGPAARSLGRELAAGLRYVWGWPGLCLLAVMGALVLLVCQPAFSLLPLLVTQHFRGGAQHLGWILSAYGGGYVAGWLALTAWGGFRRRMVTSRLGLAAAGAATLLLALTPAGAFPLALVAAALLGLAMPFAHGPLSAALQASIAPELQGRVFTLLGSTTDAAAPLGLAVAAPVADALGVSGWLLIAGLALLILGAAGLLIPAVVHLEDGRPGQSGAAVGMEPF